METRNSKKNYRKGHLLESGESLRKQKNVAGKNDRNLIIKL